MKHKRLNKIKFIRFIGICILMIGIIWFAYSYGEILFKNLSGNVELSDINIWHICKNIE